MPNLYPHVFKELFYISKVLVLLIVKLFDALCGLVEIALEGKLTPRYTPFDIKSACSVIKTYMKSLDRYKKTAKGQQNRETRP